MADRLISFSLFGTDPMYSCGAVENVLIAKDIYPEFTCRFYTGSSVPVEVQQRLTDLGAQVVHVAGAEDWSSTCWRIRALLDQDADVILFRDADSRPDEREAAATGEWLTSGKQFHVMRDHPEHGMEIMAGMWGCTRDGARRVRDLVPESMADYYQCDQVFLRDVIYPVARMSLLVHDDWDRFEPADFNGRRPFPTRRTAGRFVGQGFHGDGSLRIPADALLVP